MLILAAAAGAATDPLADLERLVEDRRSETGGKVGRRFARAARALGRSRDGLVDDTKAVRSVARSLSRLLENDRELAAAVEGAVGRMRDDFAARRAQLQSRLARVEATPDTAKGVERLAAVDASGHNDSDPRRSAKAILAGGRRLRSLERFLDRKEVPDPPLAAPGARHAKSGSIRITDDSRYLYVVNADNDSVSRIDTTDDSVTEYLLPEESAPHRPLGLDLTADGREVWVAARDSDSLFVLDAGTGTLIERIALPWGSGPASVAFAPDGTFAVVALNRLGAVVVVDTARREVLSVLKTGAPRPLGIAFAEDGKKAWVLHVLPDEEESCLTRISFEGPFPTLDEPVRVRPAGPTQTRELAAPCNVPEGGTLIFRGHAAAIPGRNEIGIPTQYSNAGADEFTPDSTIQAAFRRLDLAAGRLLDGFDEKVVLTALHVHDTAEPGSPCRGEGWNAGVAGPIDLAFSTDGRDVALIFENSDDVVWIPTDLPATRPQGAGPLVEIPVGHRPIGIVRAPASGLAYVLNRGSRDVSVVDLGAGRELRRIATTPVTRLGTFDLIVQGSRFFHTSARPELSGNGKVSCASCHLGAEHDGLTWAFQHLPDADAPRETPSLLGFEATFEFLIDGPGPGQVHRSGDRDEVQDFEHTMRGPLMGGTGFLADRLSPTLGEPNRKKDTRLDTIAYYVRTLPAIRRSPYRAEDGSLMAAAARGAELFRASDCARCHVPETAFVDFGFHDVGAGPANTPTLVGLFATAPYDGKRDLGDYVDGMPETHGRAGELTDPQRADLVEYLLSIVGDTN